MFPCCTDNVSSQVGNKLVISRTFNTDDREFVRTEVVTNPAVIDAYMKIAGNKQLKYNHFLYVQLSH